tara:strand:+ start:575 stop:796 length:222 start_codon:yes stop_codon:yes gene_type:complete
MKNLLSKYPIIYLLLFCFGSLVFGLELSETIKHGLPKEDTHYYLKISGLFANILFAIYFFYCFVRIKNRNVEK